MSCMKCGGLMVHEHFRDYLGTQTHCEVIGWRCVICGLRHDRLIQIRQTERKEAFEIKNQSI
ncbi:MAG: hypothetical protein HY200_03970 [Nitrospirae bacterium]|nr:hypothetical protein [Nitrospirota bacterium]MBI3594090.1 hypothetical protein [Nitrospirota bacterium]